jgi:phage repressor protein C with HTH and peptisase S24 domain
MNATLIHRHFVGMDEPITWKEISRRLDDMGRGARSRLSEALGMDRSQLARTLRYAGFPRTDQARIVDSFFEGKDTTPAERRSRDEGFRVPLYGYAAGGGSDIIAFNEGRILDWIELPRGMTLRGDFFVVQTIGSSMEPRIWAGERKIIQKGVPPGRDQDAVFEFKDGTAVLKTYKREKDGVVFAEQYNPPSELRYAGTSIAAMHAVFHV